MTLGIYKDTATQAISTDDSYSNPAKFEQPVGGGATEYRFYLKSDNPTSESFSNIIIYTIDTVGDNESGWITYALDSGGAPGSYSATLETSLNINETKYFWIKVTSPATNSPTTKTDVRVLVKYIRITV